MKIHTNISIKEIFCQDNGQGLAEYSFILLLVALGVISVLSLVGGKITGLFDYTLNEWP